MIPGWAIAPLGLLCVAIGLFASIWLIPCHVTIGG